jgi:hypothetical protein
LPTLLSLDEDDEATLKEVLPPILAEDAFGYFINEKFYIYPEREHYLH